MDIDYVLKCLSEIDETDLHSTEHFEKRLNQRINNLVPDINSIYSKVLTEKPVSIAKQNDTTFKLQYVLDDDNDMSLIISSGTNNTKSFNLVTYFMEKSIKRKRQII